MKRVFARSLWLLAALAVVVWAGALLAADRPAVEESSPTPADQAGCELLDSDAPMMLMNANAGVEEPTPQQIAIPRCNCTLSGTPIPPGQLGIKCASPIGGPLVTCVNTPCYTRIDTPWINGVCQ